MVDEYEEHDDLGDFVEIFDGYDYHSGRVVTHKMVPTGKQVCADKQHVVVTVPEMRFVVDPQPVSRKYVEVQFREKVRLRTDDHEYIERLKEKHQLDIVGDGSQGYVTNFMRYHSGMASKKIIF